MKNKLCKKKGITNYIKYSTYRQNFLVIIIMILLFGTLSVGYALLSRSININGNVVVRGNSLIRISNFNLNNSIGGAIENYNSNHLNDRLIIGASLPNLNSELEYSVAVVNNTNKRQQIKEIENTDWNNPDIEYIISGLDDEMMVDVGQTLNFSVTLKYKSYVSVVPSNKDIAGVIKFTFGEFVGFIDKPYIEEFNVCNNFNSIGLSYSCSNGIINISSTTADPQMIFRLDDLDKFNPRMFNYAVIKYKLASSQAQRIDIFMTEAPTDGTYLVTTNLLGDSNWRLAIIDLSSNPNTMNFDYIRGFRFDPVSQANINLQIDYIKFTNDPSIHYGYVEDFSEQGNFQAVNATYTLHLNESYVTLVSTNLDPQFKSTLSPDKYFDVSKYRYLIVRYKTKSTNLYRMEFFINHEDPNYSMYTTNINKNGNWSEAWFDLGQNPTITSDNIFTFYRFDFSTASGTTVDVDWIKFSEVIY